MARAPIEVSRATTSVCRLHPVFSNTRLTCVRTVLDETPPSREISSTVFPDARLRATRASAEVKSKRACTSSMGGAFGNATLVTTTAAEQRTNMSRAERRIGTTCTIDWPLSAPRSGKERTLPPSRSMFSIASASILSAMRSLKDKRSPARQWTRSGKASIRPFTQRTLPLSLITNAGMPMAASA